MTNVDVARLRLISAGVHRAGNDTAHIGVHDANLLFRGRSILDLSDSEKTTLLTAGLRYMENQNVPFWHWTSGDVKTIEQLVRLRMVIVDDSVSASALEISEIFGYRVPDLTQATDSRYWIIKWFEDEHAYRLHNAAERYLYRWGEEEDIPALQQVRDKKTGQQATNLDCLVVRIKLRNSQTDGFKELVKRNPEQISPVLHETLHKDFQGLPSELLEKFAKLKAASVRLASIKELIRRGALTQELAEELSGDNFVEVRLEAIKALSDKAVPISESKAREALVVEKTQRGLMGLFAVGGHTNDMSKFDNYQRHLLTKNSLDELIRMDNGNGPFDVDALLAACRTFPRKTEKLLKGVLKDGFEERFESRLRGIETLSSSRVAELTERARDLKKYTCLRQSREALNILVSQMKKRDLTLVREVIDRWEIQASNQILAYLARFGGWEDVNRILELTARVDGGSTVLGAQYTGSDDTIGETLYRVGSMRMVDLLDVVQSKEVLVVLIKVSSRKVFSDLSDDKMLDLMNVEHDNVRKFTAVKCLDALAKARILKLFQRYMERDEYRYYNVIHWLDLGVSMPKAYVKKIVQRELQGT